MQQHQPDRRHGRGDGHLLGIEQFVDGFAVHLAARHDHLGADHRAGLTEAPGIGVEHRHDGQDDVPCADAHGVGHGRHHGVQDVGAMRIKDALGIAGGARGVAHAAGGVLADIGPFEIAVGPTQPFLIANDIGQRGLGHVGGVGHDDDLAQRFDRRGELLHKRHEGQVGEDGPVGRMVHDPGDLLEERGAD